MVTRGWGRAAAVTITDPGFLWVDEKVLELERI